MGDTASLLQAHRADPNTMDPETFAALANSSNNVQQESLDVMLGNMQIQNDKPEDSGVSSKEEFSDETSEMKALEKMLEDLLERGNTLLEEMKKFSSLLTKGKNTLVSRYIHDGVKKEIESIEMV
ncbi:hypothetical protein M501DRAFT_1004984 [Patellaria atrata CBS 101060]|uniref:Uncharacterized protein n=1 Tax=Patellaria atrata CBS 101060 TaxID=1346257 RepID=A0A9P4S8V5_9PEZI|nr:hypothetical protein M501DRAFT_1004984 [Patellaria atrata CBS 101060]